MNQINNEQPTEALITTSGGEGTDSGTLHFEVDAGLLFQLGEQLVTRPSIALAELIKNGYDADATKVVVLFDKVTRPNGVIVVEDNGLGMTFEDIDHSWMRISTNAKSQKNTSKRFCRPLTGAKGVGRFASRRLSNELTISSIALREDKTKEQVTVHFNWKHFLPGTRLTTIPVTYTRRLVNTSTPTGVTLYLEDIRDPWTESDFLQVQKDLLSLTSPFSDNNVAEEKPKDDCEVDQGFKLEFISEEFPSLSGSLSDKFLNSAWGQLSGYVDENGIFNYALKIRGVDAVETFVPEGDAQQTNTKVKA